jgi:hypothetical protein
MTDETTQTVDTTAVDQTQAPVEQAPAVPAGPSLQLSDLVLALQTIQAMAQRGAIRADEMSTVGPLHDRLFAFLEAQGAIQRPQPATEAAPATDVAPAVEAPATGA